MNARRTPVFVFALLGLVALRLALCSPAFAMDQVRIQTRADEAVAKYGVSGRGVTVVILDRGIDWRHQDFRHPDGTTRIKWLLDMTGQRGCPGNPTPTEYTEAQINAALAGGAAILTDDFVGHGTVTAGLAAGNGSAFAGGRYHGMAPEADLVIVKLVSDGAPAHDGIPAEPPFTGCLIDALQWVEEKIQVLGQPAVAIANIGTQYGPIDGTSAVSRQIDEIFGLDRPGRVFVAPPGDEGGVPNHAGGSYDATADTIVRFTKATSDTTQTSLWYTGAFPATVTITFDDGIVVGPVGPDEVQTANGVSVYHYLPGLEFWPWQSTSGDSAVDFVTSGHTGAGTIRIRGLEPGTGRFDLYGDIGGPGFLSCNVCFADHRVPGRLTDLASTLGAVVAAVAVNRRSYVDIDGVTRVGFGDDGGSGTLWSQSPGGPTRDGRLGVDITLPGDSVFAAYGQNSWWKAGRGNLIVDGGGWYGRGGGGSGSGPILTGIVALMLQLNPALTARQIKQILHDSAVVDQFTGAVPNQDWGYGKLDVLNTMDRVALTIARSGRVRDLNGDGNADILWRHASGPVYSWLMNGTAVIGTGTLGSAGTDWTIAGLGDFNGDGRADILWRHTTGTIAIWFMNGTTVTGVSVIGSVSADWSVAGVGDFDGDGKADILWRHTSGLVYVWLVNGASIVGTGSPGSVSPDWTIVGVGDFNGDGRADILWRHTSGVVYTWLMNGTSIVGTGSPGSVSLDWTIQGVGDHNGDGKADILWRHSSGVVYVWLIHGTSVSGAGSPGTVGTDWSIRAVGDFDGDGRADILWAHTTGVVYVWLLNGTSISGSGSPGSVDSSWAIQ